MRRLLLVGVVVAAALRPAPALAQEEDAIARTAPVERRHVVVDEGPNRLLLATGLATFGFSYLASAYAGAASDHPSAHLLVVPLAGPWLALGGRGACADPTSTACAAEPAYKGLLIGDGVVQLAGAAQIIAAFIKRELRSTDEPVVQGALSIVPTRGGAALTAAGSF